MEVEKAEKGAASDSKLWLLILAALSVVIVILTVVIIVIALNKSNSVDVEGGGNATNAQLEEAEKIYNEYAIEIDSRTNGISAENEDAILEVYNDYISKIENRVAQAMVLSDYYQIIMIYDTNKEKKDEVLDKFLEIDGILKTANSAASVMNAAGYYGDDILFERYSGIVKERELAEGIDTEMETNG